MPALSLAMPAAIAAPAVARQAAPVARALAEEDRRLLAVLRGLAREAQLSGPIALETTCRLMDAAPEDQARAYGAALLRSLALVATRPLVFHPRGAAEVGFDEAWLVRLVRCLAEGDEDSARLLIGSRVLRIGRRIIAFLAKGFAERLGGAALDAANLEPF